MAAIKQYVSEPGGEFKGVPIAANDNQPVLAIVQAFDFREEDIPPRDWIVPGVLIRGHVSLLVAPPGAGKSLFTLQLTTAAARGLRPVGIHRELMTAATR
ncbi:AAA family ATPase [Aquamicrobium lusatiense]|uniref:AAA family ATPase n=1 Tax=Aquamicrobium lusatiense TaxID=89772 RepID=UPI002457041F|nr:AAA family ATPase [Aquamicrobium lusatiense]MDH4990862.1 AAA family ATPase [Aquamicrobium lusatiense]